MIANALRFVMFVLVLTTSQRLPLSSTKSPCRGGGRAFGVQALAGAEPEASACAPPRLQATALHCVLKPCH
jgi:hypothetical protein